jgi:hypothetical protein
MKHIATLFMSALFATVAFAADPAPAANSQQSKMSACNKDAAGKKGDERKAFMKDCLSAKPAADKKAPSAAQQAQRDKMKTCNADAKSMKGDERKKFMSKCLSKK